MILGFQPTIPVLIAPMTTEYATKGLKLYWADAAGPVSPEVKVELKPARADDQNFVAAVEKYAVSSGFLKQTAVNFDDPEFAASRWHFENGDPKEGTIKSLNPQYRSSRS
jgi:hypothetical protein